MQSKKVLFNIAALILAASLIVSTISFVNAQSDYKQTGAKTGSATTAFSATINTFNSDEMSIILQAVGGNFTNATATIAVSVDDSSYITVDTISLGTATSELIQYSSGNLTSTGINAALYPNVKVSVPSISGVAVKATWTLG